MRNRSSFYMSYQQHEPEHGCANGYVQKVYSQIDLLESHHFKKMLETIHVQVVPQELFQKNNSFASNVRWGQMYTRGIRRV